MNNVLSWAVIALFCIWFGWSSWRSVKLDDQQRGMMNRDRINRGDFE